MPRAWHAVRPPGLPLWLNASGEPAEVAARAGPSTRVLQDVYVHCISGQDDTVSQRIEDALDPGARVPRSSRCGKASGYAHRRHHHPDPVRYLYVNQSPVLRTAHGRRVRQTRNTGCRRWRSIFLARQWLRSSAVLLPGVTTLAL